MRSRVALAGSIAIHGVLGALLVLVGRSDPSSVSSPTAHLELIEAPSFVQLVDLRALDGGGRGDLAGGQRSSSDAPKAERQGSAHVDREPAPVRIATRDARSTMPRMSEPRTLRAELGEVSIEARDVSDASGSTEIDGSTRVGGSSGFGGSGGTGGGSGQGGGIGRGIGRGIGNAIAPQQVVLPPAPRTSKARPPKLIYPTRERDVDEGELFVARVTIDTDGYVVGSRLIRGAGGRRDSQAASQIFRFRYAPALDDDGTPIRATIEQPFLVQ